jgi:hypothetical protein
MKTYRDVDVLCSLVVRMSGSNSEGPGVEFRRYQIF